MYIFKHKAVLFSCAVCSLSRFLRRPWLTRGGETQYSLSVMTQKSLVLKEMLIHPELCTHDDAIPARVSSTN